MARIARIRRVAQWAIVVLTVLFLAVPFQGIIWDGAFPSVECRFRFVDGDGKPVPGVILDVRTRAGGTCHFYPVDEFVPDRPVVSNADGWLVFHHTGYGLEYGGREYSNVIGMRFGETQSPHYDCVFLLHGREVFRCRFGFRGPDWNAFRQPDVTREWNQPCDERALGLLPGEEWDIWRKRVFDTNADGTLDREERTAAGNTLRRLEPDVKFPEMQYHVIERTITVPPG